MIRIPRTKRGITAYIFAIAMLTFSLFATANSPTPKKIAKAPTPATQETQAVLGENTTKAHVTRVIDGDTFEIDGKTKVRLIGIDAPESVDPKKKNECYGQEASARTTELLLNQDVTLVKDKSETDSFGRLLRYVYLGDLFFNKSLVEEGYAVSKSYPPDTAHQEEFRAAELTASFNKRGLWSACKK